MDSLIQTLRARNSSITYEAYKSGLSQRNAVDIIGKFDVVLDATDNVKARYIISDACVVVGVPLVSGAAIGTEGQLSVYNYNSKNNFKPTLGHERDANQSSSSDPPCPCYRCIFPQAPNSDECRRCDEAGVLGPVPGVIGVLQALEAMKVLGGFGDVLCRKMLLFDGLTMRTHVVKLRGRSDTCMAHSLTPSGLLDYDYEAFTGQRTGGESMCSLGEILESSKRIEASELKDIYLSPCARNLVLLDVRPKKEYAMIRLSPSINIPLDKLEQEITTVKEALHSHNDNGNSSELIVLCRRGNDSQKAVQCLERLGVRCRDLRGGLYSWRAQVDHSFPIY